MKISKSLILPLLVFLFLPSACYGQSPNEEIQRTKGYSTREYNIFFNPYPLIWGERFSVTLRVPFEADKVTVVLGKNEIIHLTESGGVWTGTYLVPRHVGGGTHLGFVYIKIRRAKTGGFVNKIADFFKTIFSKMRLIAYRDTVLIEGKFWYRVEPRKPGEPAPPATSEANVSPEANTFSAPEIVLPGAGTSEIVPSLETRSISVETAPPQITVEAGSAEGDGIIVKGTKILTFHSTSVVGSSEGMPEGTTLSRDESLKLNISGRASGTDVDATVISTSTTGTNVVNQQQDKVSILLRRGSTEAYWGDYTANFDDVEYARIDRVLSGLKVTGNYDRWGFKAIASSPKGESKTIKIYGDGTQGPYNLGFAPVVVDSERVSVDGQELTRGNDYDIDYEGGTVTFRKRTIIATSIIRIDFDYRETPYQHSTYGLRFVGKPFDNLRLGATYINDSDSITGAKEQRESMTVNPVDPASHYIVGLDGSYIIGPELKLDSEFAYSEKNPNIIATPSEEAVYKDSAFKMNTSSDIGPIEVATRFKRIGSKFESIGDALPKQDLWLTGGDIGYRPNEIFYSQGTYDNLSYLQGGVRYKTLGIGSKTKLMPQGLPALSYFYNHLEESNDPVSGDLIDRLTIRNAADATYRFGFLNNVLSGSNERRMNRTPSEEVTVYKIVGFGSSTTGLDKISVSGNVELKETDEPNGGEPTTKTTIFNLSATPVREYFASVGVNNVDDSEQGVTTVTDLAYRANPLSGIASEGKYTITSVKDDFGSTPEVVSKQVGSFRIDLRPVREFRLRHTYKPNFEIVQKSGILSFNDNSNQTELTWSPMNELSTGVIYNVEDMYSMDKTEISLERVLESSNTRTTTLTLKAAPVRILSIELNYTLQNTLNSNLVSAETESYEDATGTTRDFDATVRTSLSESFSIDSRYTYEKSDNDSTDLTADVDTQTQTGSLKGTWNIDGSWSVYGSGAYSETIDYLTDADPFTYTVSPGLGIIYRLANMLRVEGSYTYSKSYAGASTEKTIYNLKTKYDANEYVHLTLNFDQEQGVSPYFKATDVVGNIEIDL